MNELNKCPHCGISSISKKRFYRHLVRCPKQPCPHCGEKFDNLRQHIGKCVKRLNKIDHHLSSTTETSLLRNAYQKGLAKAKNEKPD